MHTYDTHVAQILNAKTLHRSRYVNAFEKTIFNFYSPSYATVRVIVITHSETFNKYLLFNIYFISDNLFPIE